MELHVYVPRVVSVVLSWLDAGNLRAKFFDTQEKLTIAIVALDDISRIEDPQLIKDIANRTLDQIGRDIG